MFFSRDSILLSQIISHILDMQIYQTFSSKIDRVRLFIMFCFRQSGLFIFSIKFGNIHFFENKTARPLKRHGRICKRSISAMKRTSLQIIINRVSKKVPLE